MDFFENLLTRGLVPQNQIQGGGRGRVPAKGVSYCVTEIDRKDTSCKLAEGVESKPAARVVRLTWAGAEESKRTAEEVTTEVTGLVMRLRNSRVQPDTLQRFQVLIPTCFSHVVCCSEVAGGSDVPQRDCHAH